MCMCVHYFIDYCTYTYVPFVSLLYPTGAASSRDQERRIVLCQPVQSVGMSLHPQHRSLRVWGYLTVRAPRGVGRGWVRKNVSVLESVRCVLQSIVICPFISHPIHVSSLSMKLYKYLISFETSLLRKWMLMLLSWNFYTTISLIEVMRGGSQ